MKVKWGMIVTEGRNKLGGDVFSRNHYGCFARTLVTPTLVQNTYTNYARNNFLYFQQNWANLTPTERTSWNNEALNRTWIDKLGDPYNPTGINLYTSTNCNLTLAGFTALTTAPSSSIPTFDVSFAWDTLDSTPTVMIRFTDPSPVADTTVLLFATAGLSPGIYYVKTQYRLLNYQNNVDVSMDTFSTMWANKFTALAAGAKVFIKAVGLNTITGETGIPFDLPEIAV